MVSVSDFRQRALALADATEVPHMDRAAFRTPRRIFATLASDGTVNFNLPPEMQDLLVRGRPAVFAPVAGGWGALGWTRCLLEAASGGDVDDALAAAHQAAQEKKKTKSKKR